MNIELKQNVETLIDEINKTHKYSMSRIYGLYNEVFGLAESPQSCASCLIRKVNELKKWLEKQNQTPIEQEEKKIQRNSIISKKGRKQKNN